MPDYLQAAWGITNLRRPFRCLNPEHEDRHPSMSYDPRTYSVRCFSCESSGDVFEVAGWRESAISFPDKVEAVASAIGYSLLGNRASKSVFVKHNPTKPCYCKPEPVEGNAFLDNIQRAVWNLLEESKARTALDYLHRRGFDDSKLADSFIGWVEHPSSFYPNMKAPRCDAGYIVLGFPSFTEEAPESVTIPYSVFRMCKTEAKPKELKPSGVPSPIWCEHLLKGLGEAEKPLFVTEGVFDAMSLTSLLDVQACALCGASGTTRLLQIMAHTPKDKRPNLRLSLDSDEAGARFTETMSEGLKGLGIPHVITKPYPKGCKDANELLIMERGLCG